MAIPCHIFTTCIFLLGYWSKFKIVLLWKKQQKIKCVIFSFMDQYLGHNIRPIPVIPINDWTLQVILFQKFSFLQQLTQIFPRFYILSPFWVHEIVLSCSSNLRSGTSYFFALFSFIFKFFVHNWILQFKPFFYQFDINKNRYLCYTSVSNGEFKNEKKKGKTNVYSQAGIWTSTQNNLMCSKCIQYVESRKNLRH